MLSLSSISLVDIQLIFSTARLGEGHILKLSDLLFSLEPELRISLLFERGHVLLGDLE